MELGVMTYEINRKTVHEVFASAKEYGFTRAQFDFYPFCKDAEINVNANLPEDITLELAKEVMMVSIVWKTWLPCVLRWAAILSTCVLVPGLL